MNEKMVIIKSDISLKPLSVDDIALFIKWIEKEYIYKWLCPDGDSEKEAWIDEVVNRSEKYPFLTHFIIYYKEQKIGFCLYADAYFLQDLYGKIDEEKCFYEIGYFIGEEEFLNKGITKIVIKKLEEKIIEIGGKGIFSDPSDENTFSVKALLSNGFVKYKDNDYRKNLSKTNYISMIKPLCKERWCGYTLQFKYTAYNHHEVSIERTGDDFKVSFVKK